MILGELVVIEIPAHGIVLAADIDDGHRRIVQICLRWFASKNWRFMHSHQ
jgi:hypothetical protein